MQSITSHSYLITISKRTFDLVAASIALILVTPLLPLIIISIKLDSKGPVLYRQLRVGKSEPNQIALFQIIKFRTMYQDAESSKGAVWATPNDPRVTTFGRFMRKTRIDEIPQLINVLRGEMSLIGPRPERPAFYQKLESAIPFFSDRTYGVMPGITGLAQVNQGYDTCLDDVRRKVALDHSYALSFHSFFCWFIMDLSILLKTISVIAHGRGH